MWNLITANGEAENPQQYYPITLEDRFEAVISGDGKWKLHLEHNYRISEGGRDGAPGVNLEGQIETSLFDLVHDPYEKVNVIDDYPDVADEMLRFAESHRQEFFE